MATLNYTGLYKLQDSIFKIIFSLENDFYLTGGTCISRFYFAKRYSDDLDFFADDSNIFNIEIKKIKNILAKEFNIKVEIESRDFIRIKVNNILQIDFVNDRVERYKDIIILENNYRIDNIENILINKITAVMGRDNPKDIFDIYLISKFKKINWNEMIEFAQKKMFFNKEDFVYRLKSFPVELLKSIKLIDKEFLNNFKVEFNKTIETIIEEM